MSLDAMSMTLRVENAIAAYIGYIRHMFWPAPLVVYYAHPTFIPAWQVAAGVLVLAGVSLVAVRLLTSRPYLALAVLSGIEAAELVVAVERGDIARLTAIPGVGKKTAERMGLELKGRLAALVASDAQAAGAVEGGDLRADLLSALLNLGYHRTLAERAVDAALKLPGETTFERRLKQALRELTK